MELWDFNGRDQIKPDVPDRNQHTKQHLHLTIPNIFIRKYIGVIFLLGCCSSGYILPHFSFILVHFILLGYK